MEKKGSDGLTRREDNLQTLARDGFVLLRSVYSRTHVKEILDGLEQAFASSEEAAIRSQDGNTYAARNVQTVWPPAREVWRTPELSDALAAVLGSEVGLVRILYFDKPPERTWALPWHKDLTIAVQNNRLPSPRFSKPTCKIGVPHVEAPVEILEEMLTARLHLDQVTEENGPLRVIPGSHQTGKSMRLDESERPQTIFAEPGDVLLMRPLLAHSSLLSREGTLQHRRILHFEFAATPALPDGYAWHEFVRLGRAH